MDPCLLSPPQLDTPDKPILPRSVAQGPDSPLACSPQENVVNFDDDEDLRFMLEAAENIDEQIPEAKTIAQSGSCPEVETLPEPQVATVDEGDDDDDDDDDATTDSEEENRPKKPEPTPTIRLSLKLNPPAVTLKTTNQYSVSRLAKEAGYVLPADRAINLGMPNTTQVPFLSQAPACNPATEGGPPPKRRRRRRIQERDEGYDKDDPFVDDSEALTMEPKFYHPPAREGFYVASGRLELKSDLREFKARKRGPKPGARLFSGLSSRRSLGDHVAASRPVPSVANPQLAHKAPHGSKIPVAKAVPPEPSSPLRVSTSNNIHPPSKNPSPTDSKTHDTTWRAEVIERDIAAMSISSAGQLERFPLASSSLASENATQRTLPPGDVGSTVKKGEDASDIEVTIVTHSTLPSSPVYEHAPESVWLPASSSKSPPEKPESESNAINPILILADGHVDRCNRALLPSNPRPSSSTEKITFTPASNGLTSTMGAGPSWGTTSAINFCRARRGPPRQKGDPLSQALEDAISQLKKDVDAASPFLPRKFPSHLKPLTLNVAQLALELGEYDDYFFVRLAEIFPYNTFTIKKLVKREILPQRKQYYETEIENRIERLKPLINAGMVDARRDFHNAMEDYQYHCREARSHKESSAWESERARPPQSQSNGSTALPTNAATILSDATQANSTNPSPLQPSDSEVLLLPKAPVKHFKWTSAIREIYYEILKLEDELCETIQDTQKIVDKTVTFKEASNRKQLYNQLAQLWPDDFMTTAKVSREATNVRRKFEGNQGSIPKNITIVE